MSTFAATSLSDIACRDVMLPPVRLDVDKSPDGTILMRSGDTLAAFNPNIVQEFFAHCADDGGKTLYAERKRLQDGRRGDWNEQSFASARDDVRAIGQWFLERESDGHDRLLILSGNSVAHAMMRLGAMAAGVASCPISPNYALMGGSYERLRYVVDLIDPTVIFAESGSSFGNALSALDLTGRTVITRDPVAGLTTTAYDEVRATTATASLDERVASADPDAHAVYMLTSGSTGMPKAVIQTQRMLSTNLHQAFQVLGRAAGWDDVMLDWLPWNHVSGAFNLFAAAVFGGSLYIDDGKPVPSLFGETIRNLREISVPYFCNVPSGYIALVEALETDAELRRCFFKRLRMLLYGGAGLPQPVYDRLQSLAVAETGHRIFMTTGYGATETASGCMAIYFETDKVGIGLPLPGVEVKLVPQSDRYEIRLRGDNVTPGYLNDPEKTAEAFDEDNYYRTGDAARFHDEADFSKGLAFAGRLAEEFKLGTGTWVYGGQVRARLVESLAPAISDLILCGSEREYLAVLGVPNVAGLRTIAGDEQASPDDLVNHDGVRRFLQDALRSYNENHPGRSTAIARFAFVRDAPSAAKHELSDKGTVNQAISLQNRGDEVEALYAVTSGDQVIVV